MAGVETAVATCGTAFGEDHVKVLRRLLLDQDEHRGEVVFTFDSDEAGRKAALRAFEVDQKFVGRTFVAVTGDGLDPCDLRLRDGDDAVRDLIANRMPLVEFVIRSRRSKGSTSTARRAARTRYAQPRPWSLRIADRILRTEYIRMLSGWTGVEQSAGHG
jgi:DNA primase